jgi:hypothetical protein
MNKNAGHIFVHAEVCNSTVHLRFLSSGHQKNGNRIYVEMYQSPLTKSRSKLGVELSNKMS